MKSGLSDSEMVSEISFLLNACHGLRLAAMFNVNASVELHTDMAHDPDKTFEYGKRLFEINPAKFIIKVPMTPAGLIGAKKLRAVNIPVNFTLGFSARQNYLAARFANPSFVNVFLGRLNAFVSENSIGSGKNVGEKATLSTQMIISKLRSTRKASSKLIAASMRDAGQVAALVSVDVFIIPISAALEYLKKSHELPLGIKGKIPEAEYKKEIT